MLRIRIKNREEERQLEHEGGPVEFGRGQPRDVARCTLLDPFVSRDHLRVEPRAGGRLWLENLSAHSPVSLDGGAVVEPGDTCEHALPVKLQIGKTDVTIESADAPPVANELLATVYQARPPSGQTQLALSRLGDAVDAETLAHWFETVITVQQAAATSEEFLRETARAVVELVGLDRGLVLLRRGEDWRVVAMHGTEDYPGRSYSRGVLDEVVKGGRTLYRNFNAEMLRESLANIDAVVAAPIFDRDRVVLGVVYGSRSTGKGSGIHPEISPLEAQIVQVLAAAVGAGLARQEQQAEAMRAQVQFEQFFSPTLARELARDQGLLEGREREVTILFSDLRNFSRLSEQLGPQRAFRLMQDLMEMQSSHILAFDGVVVDYYGDGLLAMWDAPTNQPDHAARACRAALAIVNELPRVNRRWSQMLAESAATPEPLGLGIGVNTGLALVGNTGSRLKFKYGPMGPTVNLANRVERATKTLGVPVLVTQSTRERLDEEFATRRLCQAKLEGAAQPIHLFELSGEPQNAEWTARRDAYEAALAHYEARRFAEACQALYPLLANQADQYDVPTLTLLSRAVECLKSMPDSFTPVLEIPHK